jgi:hypothetical protein
LQRILGQIEIADETDQRGQRAARLVAEYFFDLDGCQSAREVKSVVPGRTRPGTDTPE